MARRHTEGVRMAKAKGAEFIGLAEVAEQNDVPERILRNLIRQQGVQTYRDQRDARRILLRAADVPGIFEPKPIHVTDVAAVAA